MTSLSKALHVPNEKSLNTSVNTIMVLKRRKINALLVVDLDFYFANACSITRSYRTQDGGYTKQNFIKEPFNIRNDSI